MPESTAANTFIERGLSGKSLTPYRSSMYRPMLYTDIQDVCQAFDRFASRIIDGRTTASSNSLDNIVNIYFPQPVTILELAQTIQRVIAVQTNDRIHPPIEIVEDGQHSLFDENDKNSIQADVSKLEEMLGPFTLHSPEESINAIVRAKSIEITIVSYFGN